MRAEKTDKNNDKVRSVVKKAMREGKDILMLTKEGDASSIVTVYNNTVRIANKANENINVDEDPEITFNFRKNRGSSSSEDKVNTSDEMMEVDINEQFILDCQRQAQRDEQKRMEQQRKDRQEKQIEKDPLQQSQQVIREAEASRARLFGAKGNDNLLPNLTNWVNESPPYMRSADVDENYLVIG